eukprot:754774-Hanusia_phi.AAC.5
MLMGFRTGQPCQVTTRRHVVKSPLRIVMALPDIIAPFSLAVDVHIILALLARPSLCSCTLSISCSYCAAQIVLSSAISQRVVPGAPTRQ